MLKSDVMIFGANGISSFNENSSLKVEDDGRLNFISSWQNYFVSREQYWEQVVSYPTANIIELYKIIQVEIDIISPIKGTSQAYIVSIGSDNSTVLYCCYNEAFMQQVNKLGLWRLTPISLPFYRHYYNKPCLLHLSIAAHSVNSIRKDVEVLRSTESKESLLLQISESSMSSLPCLNDDENQFLAMKGEEASRLCESEIDNALRKPSLLKYTDLISPLIKYFFHLKERWGSSAKYVLIFIVCVFLSFNLGWSAFLIWQNNYLSNKVEEQREEANRSVNVVNKLNTLKADILKINNKITQTSSKALLLAKLNKLTESDASLIIQSVEIYKNDVKISGVSSNATDVLSILIKLNEFENIKFISPPSSRGKDKEFFNISFEYKVNSKIASNNNEA